MDLQEAIAKKEDIEHEIAQRLNTFIAETGLIIERVTINENLARLHGLKGGIEITLDVRL